MNMCGLILKIIPYSRVKSKIYNPNSDYNSSKTIPITTNGSNYISCILAINCVWQIGFLGQG